MFKRRPIFVYAAYMFMQNWHYVNDMKINVFFVFRYGFKTEERNGEKRKTRRRVRGDLHTTPIRRPAAASQWTPRRLRAEN